MADERAAEDMVSALIVATAFVAVSELMRLRFRIELGPTISETVRRRVRVGMSIVSAIIVALWMLFLSYVLRMSLGIVETAISCLLLTFGMGMSAYRLASFGWRYPPAGR